MMVVKAGSNLQNPRLTKNFQDGLNLPKLIKDASKNLKNNWNQLYPKSNSDSRWFLNK